MKKISEIISLPVISLYESEHVGIIHNILFDYKSKKCSYAIIFNDNDSMLKIIKMSDIYEIGKDCIFIKNKTQLELETNCQKELEIHSSLINLNVYNLKGENIGISTDILVNNKYELIKVILNNGIEINTSEIFNISKSTLLIDSQKTSIYKFKPRPKIIKFKETESKVMILSDFITEKEKKTTNIITTQQNSKIITDFRFLVGRILNKDIIAMNGELIAKKDTIITKDIVNKASSYGKLVEIARYSIKKNKNA